MKPTLFVIFMHWTLPNHAISIYVRPPGLPGYESMAACQLATFDVAYYVTQTLKQPVPNVVRCLPAMSK